MQISFFTIVIFIWLLVLSIFALRIFFYFSNLSRSVDKGNLVNLLERVLDRENNNVRDIDKINKQLLKFEDEGKFHIQKVGLVKFNPFKELGGEHSFALALLDGKDTGVIITSLHTRERTRVYVKDVKKAKTEHELSDEEKRALKLAQKV